jgi:hypothetical protein
MASKTSMKMHLETRIENLAKKIQVLELLERKLAAAVMGAMPAKPAAPDHVPGYDVLPVRTDDGVRYCWRHFLRGARSPRLFKTHSAALGHAKRDAVRYLTQERPSQDLYAILENVRRADDASRVSRSPTG